MQEDIRMEIERLRECLNKELSAEDSQINNDKIIEISNALNELIVKFINCI